VVPDEVRFQEILFANRPYPQPEETPFTVPFMAYGIVLNGWSLQRVWRHRPYVAERIPFALGLGLWFVPTLHDMGLVLVDFPTVAYLMDWGFVFFATSMMVGHAFEHVRMLDQAADTQVLLQTRRASAEARSLMASQISRSILESVEDGIVALDAEGRVLLWSSPMRRWTGLAEDEARGRQLPDLTPLGATSRKSLRAALVSVAGGVVADVGVLREASGERVWDCSLVPHRHEDGSVEGVIGVFRDITEKRQLETQRAQIDRMVTVGRMAAGVGHEINNPLTYLFLNIDHIVRGLDSESTLDRSNLLEIAGEARDGADRIRSIVAQLQSLAKSHDAPERRCVRLSEVIEWAVRTSAHEVRHKATVELDLDEACTVDGHSGQLGQVVLNLLINAARAIPEGAASDHQIRVRLFRADDEVHVEVRDTGRGLPSEELERIFDPFYTSSEDGTGTGLGLAISRRIVQAHHGQVVAQNWEQGALLLVRLPPSTLEPSLSGGQRLEGGEGSSKLLVAIVDDEPMLLRAMDRYLLLEGVETRTTVDPHELLQWIEDGERFDLVLCDLMIPAMSGMELYSRLERDFPQMANRCVFITGGVFSEQAREFVERHRERCILKPFDLNSLGDDVRRLAAALGNANFRPPID